MTRDSENESRRLLLPGKNNLTQEGNGLAFSIIGEPPRICWEHGSVMMSANDALAAEHVSREQKRGPNAEALGAALSWLRSALTGGPRLAKDLLDEWKNGQDGSERTLKRAKKSLGVESYHKEIPGAWWWRLPAKDAKLPGEQKLGPLVILAKTAGNLPAFGTDCSKGAKLQESGILGPERVQVTV